MIKANNGDCALLPERSNLTVLTLNIWGIPWISKDYQRRMKMIGKLLKNEDNDPKWMFDVVCMQEVWCNTAFEYFKKETEQALPFSHYFYSGVIGSGICILSKWPIVETFFHQWQLNGYMHKIFHGDWFGGKGVGLCRIDFNGLKINVFTAHLHAQYNIKSDEYYAHRVTQAFDTAEFVRLSSGVADVSILGGDLNTEPDHLCQRIVQQCAGLTDAYQKSKEAEATFNCRGNIYADENEQGQRIDYILYRGDTCSVRCVDYFKPFPLKDGIILSDHEPIAATFEIIKDATSYKTGIDCAKDVQSDVEWTIEEGKEICMKAKKELKRQRFMYWLLAMPMVLLLMGIPLFTSIPKNYSGFYTLFSASATVVAVFSSLMATLWNGIESNGFCNAYESMTFLQNHLRRLYPKSFHTDKAASSKNKENDTLTEDAA